MDFITLIEKNKISFTSLNHSPEEYKINMTILTKKQVNNQFNQNYQLSEIRAFFRIAEDMEILEKDLNKIKVKIETNKYKENFDFELI